MPDFELLSYKSVEKTLNDMTYTNHFYNLSLLARSRFKWNNLPNGINEKWIEKYLFEEGSCIFFKDKTLGFMVTRYGYDGGLNYYNEPTGVRAYATDYVPTFWENNVNCIIIGNNDDYIPTRPKTTMYSAKLTNIDRAIDTNINLQKIPYVITCSDKQKLSFKQVIKQTQSNEPVIYGDKNLDLNEIKVLKTDVPIVFDKLQIQKDNILNEYLTSLGINNANTNKRERLIVNEVDSNNQYIKSNEDVELKARENACKLINEMFGLNISVERRTDIIIDSDGKFEEVEE